MAFKGTKILQSKSGHVRYVGARIKKSGDEKLVVRKHDPNIRKHAEYKEVKKLKSVKKKK